MLILDQVRTLPDAEFKVYAILTGLFALEPGMKGKISARDLAEAANVSRRSVQYAMDNLAARNLIHITPGAGPKPPTITLTPPVTAKITGANFAPVAEERVAEIHRWVAQKQRQYSATGANFAPVGDLFPQATGANSTPVDTATGANLTPVGTEGLGDAGARIESTFDSIRSSIDAREAREAKNPISMIERVLAAKPHDWGASELREARRWVHGYQCAVGDKFHASPKRNRNPPDDKILAQILTAAGSLAQLINTYHVLQSRSEPPGETYGWWVYVVLDIVHGIKSEVQKKVRSQLKIARKPSPPAITGEQQSLIDEQKPDPGFGRDLMADVVAKRKSKGA